ncbi:MAG TPA: hypothetical protein VJB87_04680 [Candidatus Nanoarchaeia archaeon]|nr:hypothetical protein [Candidatus Nanoarchaeia archaeon]
MKSRLIIRTNPPRIPSFLQSPNGLDLLVTNFVKKNGVFAPKVTYFDNGRIAVLQWSGRGEQLVMFGPREHEEKGCGCGAGTRRFPDTYEYHAEGFMPSIQRRILLKLEAHTIASYHDEPAFGGPNRELIGFRVERLDTSSYWFVGPGK